MTRAGRQGPDKQGDQRHGGQRQQMAALGSVKAEARKAHRRGKDDARGVVVAKPDEFRQRPLNEELRGKGGDRQIRPAQPQAWQTENQPHRRRRGRREHQRYRQGQTRQPQVEVAGRKGAHRHEGRRSQRDLPDITRQQVQTDASERQRQKRQEDRLDHTGGGKVRCGDEGRCQQNDQRQALGQLNRRYLGLGKVEHQNLSTSFSPNRPEGRTNSTNSTASATA